MTARVGQDPDREIRSMILSCFPCPPLPQLAVREESARVDTVSSHDTVAAGIQGSNHSFTAPMQETKILTQQKLQETYNAQLDSLYAKYRSTAPGSKERDAIIEEVYDTMQNFTRRMVGTYSVYLPRHQVPDCRYVPMDEVCVGDTVHKRACEHLVAQRIVVGRTNAMPTYAELKDLPYKAIIEKFFVMYSEDAEHDV